MDYLPIQASAVPCERAFSSSSETDTKKRNRISPLLMEALQMLKFLIKQDRLNFIKPWVTLERDLEQRDETQEVDLLARLIAENTNEIQIMDEVIAMLKLDDDTT